MGFLDALKEAAAETGQKVGEGAKDFQTKRELARFYDELGEIAYELSKSGVVSHPEITKLTTKIDTLDAMLESVETADEASEAVRFRSLRAMFKVHDEPTLSVESFLVRLVQAVRDEETQDRSGHDVYVTARKRRRKLGLIAFGTGPLFAGIANQVADLYCETAVVCEVASLHKLDLSDEEIAAHMLVLWSVSEDLSHARAAVRGDPPVAKILGAKLFALAHEQFPENPTTRSIVKGLWDVRGTVGDSTEGSSNGSVRTVIFTGHRTKKVIRRAERQLGVS